MREPATSQFWKQRGTGLRVRSAALSYCLSAAEDTPALLAFGILLILRIRSPYWSASIPAKYRKTFN